MSDREKQQEAGTCAGEIDDQQLDQVAGGTLIDPATSRTTDTVGAPKKSFAEKLDAQTQGVAQVGLGVAAN